MEEKKNTVFSCVDCHVRSCDNENENYPSFCPTKAASEEEIEEIKKTYLEDPELHKMFNVAAGIEAKYYGRLTRVEETILFIKQMGYKKIGIATCMGLINEATLFAKALRASGIEDFVSVCCKVGSIDKTEIGIADENKVHPGGFEPCCNPVMQAKVLNDKQTDFNIVIGLCVGHDTAFLSRSKAPCTVMVVKDRVLVHNPCAALYAGSSYYKRIMNGSFIKEDE